MRVLNVPASDDLARLVDTLTIVESDEGATRLLVPARGLILGFRYRGSAHELSDGGAVRLPDAVLSGMRRSHRMMRTARSSGIVLVTFRPGGAAPFFGVPLHELFGASLELADLVPRRRIALAAERVASARSDRERTAAVEDFLREQRRAPGGRYDAVATRAARAIVASRGAVRIGAVARSLGLSRDRLEKRFRAAVGTTPKQLASIVRLHEALALYRPGASLAQLAAEAGYFDQAHLTRDFRALTGSPPKRFFASIDHC